MEFDVEPTTDISILSKKYSKKKIQEHIVALRTAVRKCAFDYEAIASMICPVDKSRLSRNIGDKKEVRNDGLTMEVKTDVEYAGITEVQEPSPKQRAPRGKAWRRRTIEQIKPKLLEATKLIMAG